MSGPVTPDNAGENAPQSKAVEIVGEDSAGEAVSGSSNPVPGKVEPPRPSRNTPKRSQGQDYASTSAAFSAPRSRRSLDQALQSASTAESSMNSRIPAGVQNSFFLSHEKNKDKLHRSPEENEERLRKLLGLADKNNAGTTTNAGGENSSNGENLLSEAQRRVHNVDAVAGNTGSEDTSADEHVETDSEPDTEQQAVMLLDDEDTEGESESSDDADGDTSAAGETDEDHKEPEQVSKTVVEQAAVSVTQPVESERYEVEREVHPRRRDWSNYTTEGVHSRVESFVRGFHALIGIERRKVIQQLKLVTEEDLLETEQLLEEASAELEKYSGYEDLSVELEEYKELAENNAAAYDELQYQLTMLMDHCEQREAYIQQLREDLSQAHEKLSTADDLLGSVNTALISIDTQKYPNIVLDKDYSGLAKVVADAERAGESATDIDDNNTASSEDNESEIKSDDVTEDSVEDSAEETSEEYDDTLKPDEQNVEE